MTCAEIDLQQSDDMDLLMELSDEALEVACGELMHGSPTLAYGSYCFTCRSSLCVEDSSRHADLSDNEPDGSGDEYQSDFRHRRISPGNSVRSGQQPRPALGRTLRTVRWLYQRRLRP